MSDIDVGLYDSDTGKSLEALKVVDVSEHQSRSKSALLVYTRAKRGLICQLQSDGTRIHYFVNDAVGGKMMIEDSERFGFAPNALYDLAFKNAPHTD